MSQTHTHFEEVYKGLNEKQREAVDTIEGPVMVIAGPGTGKTTILTVRIGNILQRTDTPPSGILAITYTDAGVSSMRKKLRELIGAQADEVRIHTFHSFAGSVIQEYPDHFIHLDKARQMSDVDRENLLREILQEGQFEDLRPIGNPDFYIHKILGSISDSKREAVTPDAVKEFAEKEKERIEQDEDSISTRGKSKGQLKADAVKRIDKCERTKVFADVFARYEERKKEEELMDFDDLITELLARLENDTLLLRILQEQFLYILVDEHQDSNDSQNRIISALADFFDEPNVFIVGDEKQAIYRFQGASVENFLSFQEQWPGMKVIPLDTNYRSHQTVLDAGFSMIEHNYERDQHTDLRVRLSAGTDIPPQPIELIAAEDGAVMDRTLSERIRGVVDAEPEASVAIIVRTNRELEYILEVCEQAGLTVSSERSVDIFSHPAGALFFSLVEFVADRTRFDALAVTVAAGLWGLTFGESVDLIRKLYSGKGDEAISSLPALQEILKDSTSDGAVSFVIELAEQSGYVTHISRDPASVEVWRGIVALSESLAREKGIIDPKELMKELLLYKASSEGKSVKVPIGVPDAQIKAMTAHKSKGLEFDHVFVPNATERAWIGRRQGEFFVLPQQTVSDGDELKDLRRLFYVALTRARKHAVVLYPEQDRDGKSTVPLRFLEEIDPESVVRVSETGSGSDPVTPIRADREKNQTANSPRIREMADHARSIVEERGLSVTALNHFLQCPSMFLYLSVLKLPQAPSGSTEKGNAMHEAFARVWQMKERSEESIVNTIKESVESYFSRSLLPLTEKEQIQRKLLSDAPVVARELREHFMQKGEVRAEMPGRATFSGTYQGATVSLPLHGKLDAVIDTPEEVLVFDYKTRKGMSERAIKGETANDDGGYFRQLIFYTLLLQSNSHYAEKRITPSLVFITPSDRGECTTVTIPVTDEDRERVAGEIQGLIESVWSGELARARCDDPKCAWCALKEMSL